MYSTTQRPTLSRIVIFCFLAEVLNLVLPWILGDILHIPLFMDTIGTVFIVFYAGLVPGLIVAGLYNILRLILMIIVGNPVYPWEMMYSLCGLAIAFLTWLFSWKNRNLSLTKGLTFLYLILISLMTAFASSLIGGAVEATQRILFDNQVYINPVRSFIMAFLGERIGLYIACMFARIPITVLDRLICTFLGFIVYKLVRRSEIQHD